MAIEHRIELCGKDHLVTCAIRDCNNSAVPESDIQGHYWIVNVRALEAPPGAGFTTVTCAVPAVLIIDLDTRTESWVAEINVAVSVVVWVPRVHLT